MIIVVAHLFHVLVNSSTDSFFYRLVLSDMFLLYLLSQYNVIIPQMVQFLDQQLLHLVIIAIVTFILSLLSLCSEVPAVIESWYNASQGKKTAELHESLDMGI